MPKYATRLVLASLAVQAGAAGHAIAQNLITLPSGVVVQWQETLHDIAGSGGLTYRFRFVMPDLAQHMVAADADPESSDPADDADENAEEAADALLDDPDLAAPDPSASDADAPDPIHDATVWLCENWALPRAAGQTPRPRQIIISLADREIAFGAYDPAAVQLFEAFRLPADRDTCAWEPW